MNLTRILLKLFHVAAQSRESSRRDFSQEHLKNIEP
jgi:hypothetical protein